MTSKSERVFSKLQQLQRTLTSIRSTMTEDWLEELIAAMPPRALSQMPDEVLSAFAKKARQLNFVL